MMIIVNHSGDQIIGSVDGKPFSINFDLAKYQTMKELEEQAGKVETMEELKGIVEAFSSLAKESYKELVEQATPNLLVNPHTNEYFLKYNDEVSTHPIPQIFVDKILLSVEKQLDFTPLLKCIVRFMRSEKFTKAKFERFAKYICAPFVNAKMKADLMKEGFPADAAVKKATTTQVAITMEGLLVGYKVSEEVRERYELNEEEEVVKKSRYKPSVDPDTGLVTYDEPQYNEERLFRPAVMKNSGDPFWCDWVTLDGSPKSVQGHLIRVGGIHYHKDWSFVNCDDNVSCVKGLHVGGLSYINTYQVDGTVTHNVLIDPADIGAICDVGNGSDGALRVRRYMVHSSFAGVNKNLYHSSKYAALNDAEYQQQLEEAVKQSSVKLEELNKEIRFKTALGK